MELIFFDINGTLIKRDNRTDIPYGNALDALLNKENSMDGINTSARSDKDVFMEALSNAGVEFSESLWETFMVQYEKQLKAYFNSDVWRENAGCVSFVKYLAGKGYKLALITGELEIGAKYKLEKLGIWDYFVTGGFGEDDLTRNGIAKAALKKLEEKTGNLNNQYYIIGDTILDITTARHIGAKVISIATGSNTAEELAKHNPDMLIDHFDALYDKF